MHIGHTGAQHGAGNAEAVEVAAVAAAAGSGDVYIQTQIFRCFGSQLDHLAVFGQAVRFVGRFHFHVNRHAGFFAALFVGCHNVGREFFQLFRITAAAVHGNLYQVRHDVGGGTAVDDADVAGGFFIDAAGRHVH